MWFQKIVSAHIWRKVSSSMSMYFFHFGDSNTQRNHQGRWRKRISPHGSWTQRGLLFLYCKSSVSLVYCCCYIYLCAYYMYFCIEIGFSMFHLSHVHLTWIMCFPSCHSPALLCTWSFCRLLRWVKMFLLCQSDQQTLQNAANSTGTGQGTKDRPCLKVARLGINGL